MKRCPYCFGVHNRDRARYCCEAHAKRDAQHVAAVKDGRERAINRILREMHARHA